MKALLVEKKEIAQGTWWFKFGLEKEVKFKPGQIFFIALKKLKYDDKRGNRRHFSIVNSPKDSIHIEMATRMRGSGFKETLREMSLGEEVDIGNISGSFVTPKKPNLVFIALGIGITPYISMLRTIKESKEKKKVTLFYSNKSTNRAPFLAELKELETNINEFKFIPIITSDKKWSGETKRIDSSFIKNKFSLLNKNYYMIAGSPNPTFAVKDELIAAGIDEENIQVEDFYGY